MESATLKAVAVDFQYSVPQRDLKGYVTSTTHVRPFGHGAGPSFCVLIIVPPKIPLPYPPPPISSGKSCPSINHIIYDLHEHRFQASIILTSVHYNYECQANRCWPWWTWRIMLTGRYGVNIFIWISLSETHQEKSYYISQFIRFFIYETLGLGSMLYRLMHIPALQKPVGPQEIVLVRFQNQNKSDHFVTAREKRKKEEEKNGLSC